MLGISNVAYVAWYRFTLKSGLRKYWFKQQRFADTAFYYTKTDRKIDYPEDWKKQLLHDADKIKKGQIRYYAYQWKEVGNPPNWFLNPFNDKNYTDKQNHWTVLPDFHPEVGDIKNLWEASRFEWVVTLGRAYAVSGNINYLNTLNTWLQDWVEKNPLNTGPNWKCGQEESIRVFNLLNTAFVLNQWATPTNSLAELIYLHLKRISGNILYAIAQDNNHGTSEAAALFIGGNWLEKYALEKYPDAIKLGRKGRYWLENRVKKLIASDGSFSQHSVNYHRVLLDTLCFSEHWRQTLEANAFSAAFYNRAKAATQWLYYLMDEKSGNAPNLGANDGAMFLNLHSCPFRDFRPSIQLSQTLFFNSLAFGEGSWNEPLFWFKTNTGSLKIEPFPKRSKLLDKGYLVIRSTNSWALVRVPNFRFRPSHNDAFHFDLFYKGLNIFLDAGTFSYNPPESFLSKPLKSVVFHNTASFDDEEQMPVIGRFLLGNWLKPNQLSEIQCSNGNNISWQGSYKDQHNNLHKRKITVENDTWLIEDELEGSFNTARIIFNVINDNYEVASQAFISSWGKVFVENFIKLEVAESIHAPHYHDMEASKRLIIHVEKNTVVRTKISFNS